MTIEELLKHIDIREDQDIEFKSADGGLPKSIWETISAFANTEGGYIVLGVTQKKGKYHVTGVPKPKTLLKPFWDTHNNPQKLKPPVCLESDIATLSIDRHKVLVIRVPRGSRQQRPVFINGNPLTGTFKRNYEGDYRCTEAEVRQMLRDASDEPQDSLILEGFDFSDLDPESLSAYRNRFASRDPGHPFLALNDLDFLERLGGLRRDRKTAEEGLTLAGLLMFGQERSILDAFPHYHLDYQEQLSSDPEKRWTYRLTIDGTWVPNLFNFYYLAYSRLINSLDVPFELDSAAVRRGETHVHEALREALVNTLIHADHMSSRPILIVKSQNMFYFNNPGRLRIPIDRLYEGGISDPRNPSLQKMFQMLGLGEKAGSGFQKILRAWREQEWFIPFVSEKLDTDITTVSLPMISMIPEQVEKELKVIVGSAYTALTEIDRLALVLAHRFGKISNADIKQYRREHSREIGERLKYLVYKGWLSTSGQGRGMRYQLAMSEESTDLFSQRFEHLEGRSEHLESNSEHYKKLITIANPVREKRRVNKELVQSTILTLCSDEYLTLRTLANLLHRTPDSLRNHYINPMIKEKKLNLRYPDNPNHPQQGYKTFAKQEREH
ncbi:MAG: RNA-binding domain-containing protein [Nitrospirota bacterium]